MSNFDPTKLEAARKHARERLDAKDDPYTAIRAGVFHAWGQEEGIKMLNPPLESNWEFFGSPVYIELRKLLDIPWPKVHEIRAKDA